MPIGKGDLCFAVFDAALVIDIGDAAQKDGRAIFVPGTVWHGTPRAGEANGRVAKHGLCAYALVSNRHLAEPPGAPPPSRARSASRSSRSASRSRSRSPRPVAIPPRVDEATPPPLPVPPRVDEATPPPQLPPQLPPPLVAAAAPPPTPPPPFPESP